MSSFGFCNLTNKDKDKYFSMESAFSDVQQVLDIVCGGKNCVLLDVMDEEEILSSTRELQKMPLSAMRELREFIDVVRERRREEFFKDKESEYKRKEEEKAEKEAKKAERKGQ